MILQKYFTNIVNGVFDPYLLFHRLSKLYDNVKYYNPLNDKFIGKPNAIVIHPLDGIKIENVYNCVVLEGIDNVNSKIKFSINLNIFSERCIILELIFDVDDYKAIQILTDEFDNIDKNTLKIEQDGIEKEISFSGIIGDFMLNKIMNFNKPEFQELINEWEPSDDSVEELILTKVKKIISAEFDAIGLNSGISVSDGFDTNYIIQDIENECMIDKSWEKISQDDEIYKSDNVSSYLVKDEDSFKKFKKDYERFVIYRNIIESYNMAFQSWYFTIENEGTDVLKNMDNENEIFWKELRLKIEKWQLNFLKQDAHRSFALGNLDKIHHYISIDNKNKVEWIKSADKAKTTMYRQIDEIKYQLENLATPGHTHDEQSLQLETEKTNERILLLSFLALSIPMLNAILSPDFTLHTKIISSIVLLSLPLFYFSTIRFAKRRIKNINRKRDMIRRKDNYLQGLERDKFDLEQIQNDKKMSIDSKNVALDMINLNIDFKEKFIKKIEKKI